MRISALCTCVFCRKAKIAKLEKELEDVKTEFNDYKQMYGCFGPITPPPVHIADFNLGERSTTRILRVVHIIGDADKLKSEIDAFIRSLPCEKSGLRSFVEFICDFQIFQIIRRSKALKRIERRSRSCRLSINTYTIIFGENSKKHATRIRRIAFFTISRTIAGARLYILWRL